MSMLAEPRRKQKWSLNPQGKQWSDDSNRFGQKMLEKMGWTSGKGLGINEQGITKHVRINFKNDKSGIGYDQKNFDGGEEHQEKFNELLQQLQKYEDDKTFKKCEDSNSNPEGRSLEVRSKQSRFRIHYKKFIQGKDVSKYSPKDLAIICSQKRLTQTKMEKDNKNDEKETHSISDSGSNVTTNSSNINCSKYKLPNDKKNLTNNMTGNGIANSENKAVQQVGLRFASENVLSPYAKNFKMSNYAFDNPCLGLDSSMEDELNFNIPSQKHQKKKKREFEESAESWNSNCIYKPNEFKVRKKLKIEIVDNNCKDGFINPALNLNIESREDCNGKEFEISRAQFGLENCGLDLTDEVCDKKRVTFNDHVEYNVNSTKNKKEKATLDKFEVENKRHKKRKNEDINILSNKGCINEALDVEMAREEINDNELNEHKSRKAKKRKISKMFGLETIQESPEREKEENKTELEDSSAAENEEISTDRTLKKREKKKQKKDKVEYIPAIDSISEESDIKVEQKIRNEKMTTDQSKEEAVTPKKREKKKKKDKVTRDSELAKDVIEINDDHQNIKILENTNLKQQDNNSIKNSKVKILEEEIFLDLEKGETAIMIEKKYKLSLGNIVGKKHKKKSSKEKDCSKNKIDVCDVVVEISDKENASEERDLKQLTKSKKRKKTKDKNTLDTCGDSFNLNAEVVEDADISKQKDVQNSEHGRNFEETPSKKSKIVDVEDDIIHTSWNERTTVSKKMLKILHYKDQEVYFYGSNIDKIKGYGVDIDDYE